MAYRPLRSQQSPNAADHCVSPSPPPQRKPAPAPYPVAPMNHWTRTIHIDQARKTDTKSEHNESELQSNGNTQERRKTEPMMDRAITFSCRSQRTKYAKGRKRWVRVRWGKTLRDHTHWHSIAANERKDSSRSFFSSSAGSYSG